MKSTHLKLVCIFAGLSAPVLAAAQVTLHYNDRPPYLVMKDGQLTGLTGSPAVAAFKAAGVGFTLAATPSARQIETIKENTGNDCAIGWFKTSEREGFGKFTKPVYQDKPQIALTAAGNSKIKDGATVASVLGNKDINMLAKKGYSYGKVLDELIAKLQPAQTVVTVENVQMLKMIQTGRSDFMFIAPEEADGLIETAGISPGELRKAAFSDAPNGENRFILCSKKVPDEIINKINEAIK